MKKSYKAVETRALNLLASNSNEKCERRGWERARDPGKEEEERESFKLKSRERQWEGRPSQPPWSL